MSTKQEISAVDIKVFNEWTEKLKPILYEMEEESLKLRTSAVIELITIVCCGS